MTEPEREKLRLEIEQIGLDVEHRRLRWFAKPDYLRVLVPVAIATLAFLAALFSGWFDDERQRLKSDNSRLREESESLQVEIGNLIVQRDALQERVDESALDSFASKFDRSQVSEEILDALPANKETDIPSRDRLKQMARELGLMGLHDATQVQFDDGDISYWDDQNLPAWRIALEFLARSIILQKATELEITIHNTGDLSSRAGKIYNVLKEIALERWGGN